MLVICLPTYNERANLKCMVETLEQTLKNVGRPSRVLVIDDGSPDGTGQIAQRLAAEHEWLDVLHRSGKRGLGPAYLAGFEHALSSGAELIVEIDCDFSHDPGDIARLLAATEEADLVIGSRYVGGGGMHNCSILRRAISRGGCLYAQALLGSHVSDLTSGFKCFRRAVLETMSFEQIRARGYAFQIETVYRATRAGFRVVEVPIVFRNRRIGASKMSYGIVAEAIWRVPALRVQAALGRL